MYIANRIWSVYIETKSCRRHFLQNIFHQVSWYSNKFYYLGLYTLVFKPRLVNVSNYFPFICQHSLFLLESCDVGINQTWSQLETTWEFKENMNKYNFPNIWKILCILKISNFIKRHAISSFWNDSENI